MKLTCVPWPIFLSIGAKRSGRWRCRGLWWHSADHGGVRPTAAAANKWHAKDYKFLDIELKYGILQIIEALSFLHYSGHVIHKNVCPSSILVTKKGTWKLAGLEFIGNNKTPSRGWCWW